MDDTLDGGPAFPAGDMQRGMSKRELFAAILMHSEAVTCGVPGEASEALVEASRAAGTDVIDHMAMNAVQGADALLRALAEPRPTPIPPHLTYDAWTTSSAEHAALKRLAERYDFGDLPALLRDFVNVATSEIDKAESGIPF
jgi:hypothetical protein